MIDLTRRRILFCAPAIILTPGLLMKVTPRIIVPPAPAIETILGAVWERSWRVGEILRVYTGQEQMEQLVRVVGVTASGLQVARITSRTSSRE